MGDIRCRSCYPVAARYGLGDDPDEEAEGGDDAVEMQLLEQDGLQARREDEGRHVAALHSEQIAEGASWYLIETHWLANWHNFISGGQPPGPIRNDRLLDGAVPRPGLVRARHYRGVNEATWLYLHSQHGGGPALRRPNIDIYDQMARRRRRRSAPSARAPAALQS